MFYTMGNFFLALPLTTWIFRCKSRWRNNRCVCCSLAYHIYCLLAYLLSTCKHILYLNYQLMLYNPCHICAIYTTMVHLYLIISDWVSYACAWCDYRSCLRRRWNHPSSDSTTVPLCIIVLWFKLTPAPIYLLQIQQR